MSHLEQSRLKSQLASVEPRPATIQELALVHDRQHIIHIQDVAQKDGGWLDGDTVMSADSFEVALYAVGGAIRATEMVMDGHLVSTFALLRPPGHHATPGRAMGFCLFNNIAIAAKYALNKYSLERILILDFDVHHGNGTQAVFYDDPRVLYISTHQYPHYPGTGGIDETGSRQGRGTTINIPLPAGCGDDEYLKVFREIIIPAVGRFKPQFILVSAGYDAHWADELAKMELTITGFARMANIIKGLAGKLCHGRLIFSLEGGYNLTVLSSSVKATLDVLLGNSNIEDPMGKLPHRFKAPDIDRLIKAIKKIHKLP
jgi:acetoin utilization deacetylase AcuC-like enzyme